MTCGIKNTPPFVIIEGDSLSSPKGFSIDLIELLAKNMNPPIVIRYHINDNLEQQLDNVENKKTDLAISATTISSEREKRLDFSYPFLNSQIGIMTLDQTSSLSLFRMLLKIGLSQMVHYLLLYIFICGNIIWLIEHRNGFEAFHIKYWKGVFTGMWWTIVTMSTVGYGDIFPKKKLGKIFATIVIISGIAFFGLAIAKLTSLMTLSEMQSQINGPQDLLAKKVCVIENTESVKLSKKFGARPVLVESIDEAAEHLLESKSDAFIHDLPMIKYYLMTNPQKPLHRVSEAFEPFSYGISFPSGSPYREDFNRVLLQAFESGAYDEIYQRWFGRLE
ncbi:MAG: transporter substrate-binding domain-containing protein [Candidatus Zixiibacteriota bacterium]